MKYTFDLTGLDNCRFLFGDEAERFLFGDEAKKVQQMALRPKKPIAFIVTAVDANTISIAPPLKSPASAPSSSHS